MILKKIRLKKLQLLAFYILLINTFSSFGKEIPLVANGKSNYMIILPKDISPSENRAAEMLQKHIEMISGCKLADVNCFRKRQESSLYQCGQ